MQLLVATQNPGKISELRDLLRDSPYILRDLSEFPEVAEVAETGTTFAENAGLKAAGYALQTGLWTLADDSGLEVAALDGEPGVRSARYAGGVEKSSDRENIRKLLGKLKNVEPDRRQARFFCQMAISDEKGRIKFTAAGACNGRIALTPAGTNGFGYDPVFIPDGYERTFGELSGKIKQKISHRRRALEKIIDFLRKINVSELDQTHFRL